jgi:LmbE family N-acetylglucosaminyl deacetylase
MRRASADLVLSLGADGAYGHPDHLAVHRWVAEAAAGLDEPPLVLFAAFPRGLFLPQYEKCLASGVMGDPPLLPADEVGVDAPDVRIDVTAVREVKLEAIAAHRTQLPHGLPEALFPPGLVAALLDEEWFAVSGPKERLPELLTALQAAG